MSNIPISPPDPGTNQPTNQPPPTGYYPPGQPYPPGTPPNLNTPPYYPPPPPPVPGNVPYGYRPYNYDNNPIVAGELVGFWPRAVALIIDSIIVSIPTGIFYGMLNVLVHPFWNDWGNFPGPQYPFGLSSSIVFWGLYAWFCYTSLRGNTLGKSVMGLKLINADGTKLSFTTYMLHFTVGYWLNGLIICIGYLWAVFDANNQTWGQKLFKDYTVRGNW